ncbi:MAG: hypothetical protein WCA13_02420 [Terriglobales bacterium]
MKAKRQHRTRPTILLAVMTFSLAASAQDSAKRAEAAPAGIISEVSGACWLQKGHSSVPITLKQYGGVVVYVGDKVRCDKGGRLVLELKGRRTSIEPSHSDDWTTVPESSEARKEAMAGPVDDYFKLAGAQRGVNGSVYSPPNDGSGSAVRPELFVIRWIPNEHVKKLWLRIRNQSGAQLWPEHGEGGEEVCAACGELNSATVRQALLKYQGTGDRALLTLATVDSNGHKEEVQFTVISGQEEKELRDRLEVCGKQPGLMKYICRAYEFRQLRLYTEAAAEYETALRELAPESVDLQLHAIVAHQLTGNYARADELTGKLPAGTQLPQ